VRHGRYTLLLSAVVLVACSGPVLAADLHNVLTDYTITSWSQKDGLPSGTIYALAQDADGYLWVGTETGLFRFDGVRFVPWEVLQSSPLPEGAVRVLRATADGSLWAGFDSAGGVSRIQNGQTWNYGASDGLPPDTITALEEDRRHVIWAGNDHGLFRFTGTRWERSPPERGLPDAAVSSAARDREGRLLVGLASGIFRESEDGSRFELLVPLDAPPRSIAVDGSDGIYVTDDIAGFRCVASSEPQPESLERGRGRHLLLDAQGDLWVGTAGQGLWRAHVEPAAGRVVVERATALTGLLADGVISLLEDREGNIWAGTTEGLNRFTPQRVKQLLLGVVAGVEALPDGSVWVGTVDEVLRFPASGTRVPDRRIPLDGKRLRAIHADQRGTIWIGTDAGVSRLGADASLVPLPETRALHEIDSVTSDHSGALWMYDLDQGLVVSHDHRVTLVQSRRPGLAARITTSFTDSRGCVWLAFDDGAVSRIEPDAASHLFAADDGLTGGIYRAFYEDRDGTIWLAGSEGLSRFSRGAFVTLRRGSHFPTDFLTAIVDDEDGNLWLGTGSGIVRLRRSEFERAVEDRGYTVHFTTYDRSDGLAGLPFVYSNSRRAIRAKDGRLWFVTGRGLTVIDPSALLPDREQPPVRIEGVLADDRRVHPDPLVALPPQTSRLEINYTVLNLTSPLKTRFRYRLDGFDQDWVDAGGRRQAYYTNLPPRAYRFQVMASNSEGAWEDAAAVWDFSIRPMFYQTAWFWTASVLALILAVWGAWRLRIRQVRHQFSLLLGERVRLSREIHDTLLQSLVGVALQFDDMANDADAAPFNRDRLVRMRKQVEEYIREARQSIFDLRSPKLAAHDLAAALREAGEQATAEHAVQFEFSLEGTPRRCSAKVEEQVLRIGQEAVVNAVRHAHASTIRMELRYDGDALTLKVTDDGRGFDPGHQARDADGHYGLVSMRERAEGVGGDLIVASRIGGGTEIATHLPLSAGA
jgi:signal transduction histidine kinase/ligand-binding sensor domain-containing protein